MTHASAWARVPTLPAFAAALAFALVAPAMAAPEAQTSTAPAQPAATAQSTPPAVTAAAQAAAAQPAATTAPGANQSPAEQPAASAAAPSPAVAAPAPATTFPAAQAPVVMPASPAAGSLLQTTLALVFVLALLAAIAWFMKRFGPRAAAGSANLRVVGALSLGGRERIMVVEVGDQWIVVGASPGRVNALATMPRQAGAEQAALLAPHATPAASFADWLKQTLDKRNAK